MLQTMINNWQSLAGTAFSPHQLLQAASCDPSIEACDASGNVLERPTKEEFVSTTLFLPMVETIVLFITPFVGFLFGSASLEAFLWLIPVSFVFAAFSWSFVISVFYLIFGANFFLFSWLDNFLAILIEHYLSNVMIFLLMIILIYSFNANSISSGYFTNQSYSYHYSVALMQIGIHLWIWN